MITTLSLVHHLTSGQIAQLHQLYQNEWWSRGRTLEETQRCVAGSLCFALVDDQGELQGFARVLTDAIFKALIFDVIVAPGQRNNRLGEQLVAHIRQHPDLQQVKHFELYCVPELEAFYEKWGFTTQVGDIRLMRLTTR